MRFTLHYEGPLKARGSTKDKQAIRDAMEAQLQELWTHPPLVKAPHLLRPPEENEKGPNPSLDISVLTSRFGHTFAPLVTARIGLRAELDILMLRPSDPGQIVVGGGDIDNRLKTLLDSLAAPQQAEQVSPDMRETTEQAPFFVLLDDDNLITRVNVETDRLLHAGHPDNVRLFIRVDARPSRTMFANIDLAF